MKRVVAAILMVLVTAVPAAAQYLPTSLEGWYWKLRGNQLMMVYADNRNTLNQLTSQGWEPFRASNLFPKNGRLEVSTPQGRKPAFEDTGRGDRVGKPLGEVTTIGKAVTGLGIASMAGAIVAGIRGKDNLAMALGGVGIVSVIAGQGMKKDEGQQAQSLPVPPMPPEVQQPPVPPAIVVPPPPSGPVAVPQTQNVEGAQWRPSTPSPKGLVLENQTGSTVELVQKSPDGVQIVIAVIEAGHRKVIQWLDGHEYQAMKRASVSTGALRNRLVQEFIPASFCPDTDGVIRITNNACR